MAETIFRGPSVVMGATEDGRVEPFDGPSIGYQGDIIANPQTNNPLPKDGLSPGRVKGWFNNFFTVLVDAIPSATNTTSIAAAQAPSTTQGVALTLITSCAGTAAGVPVFTPGVPIIPLGTTSVVTVSAIDFGFATGTTTVNSTSVTVVDNRLFTLGQWLVIGGAAAATNQCLITQVMQLHSTNTTLLYISPSAGSTCPNAPIGQGNLYSQLLPPAASFGPNAASANAAEPYRGAGLAAAFDPAQGVARNLILASSATASGTTAFMVTGYDIYGNLMTELISASGTAATYNPGQGIKAWKYISSIKVQTAGTTVTPANVSIGAGAIVGMNLRSDKWEYTDFFFNGGFSANSTGWTAAVTGVATNTTGDVRGTQNFSTGLFGNSSGSATSGGAFDGVKRLTVFQTMPMINCILANPTNFTSLLGVAQSTT